MLHLSRTQTEPSKIQASLSACYAQSPLCSKLLKLGFGGSRIKFLQGPVQVSTQHCSQRNSGACSKADENYHELSKQVKIIKILGSTDLGGRGVSVKQNFNDHGGRTM